MSFPVVASHTRTLVSVPAEGNLFSVSAAFVSRCNALPGTLRQTPTSDKASQTVIAEAMTRQISHEPHLLLPGSVSSGTDSNRGTTYSAILPCFFPVVEGFHIAAENQRKDLVPFGSRIW